MKDGIITHHLFWYIGVSPKRSQNRKTGELWVLRWENRRVHRASILAGIAQMTGGKRTGLTGGEQLLVLLLALSSCLQFLAP